MGLRLRKSINLGLGFRINLSKSGVGYSWGFPGYRATKLANGGNRTTYSLPGSGISYVEQSGKKSPKSSDGDLMLGDRIVFENIPIDEIEKNDPILKEINKVVKINRIANILIILGFLSVSSPYYLICLILGIIIKLIILWNMKISLSYSFDEDSKKMYNSIKDVLILLSNSERLWQINSSVSVLNSKYNAGARNNVARTIASITNKLPWFIETNIDIFGLNLNKQRVFFTPDRIIVFKRFGSAFGCKYNDMHFNVNTVRFVESERVCKDSEIVDYAWRYSNNDGSRDLRFSNNKRFPVCKYGIFEMESPYGIKTMIYFSNDSMEGDIRDNLMIFGSLFNKILKEKKQEQIKDISSQENENNSDYKNDNKNVDKIIINSLEELKNTKIKKENNSEQKQNYKVTTTYKIPAISILDDESKNVIPFIDKMKSEKNILIPIGFDKSKMIIESISSMPNLLIGGTVMSGKSAYINTIIGSILLTKKPSEVRLMIYDSKRIEYSCCNGLPHLLCPVITDSKRLELSLKKIVSEIEHRYDVFEECLVKNIDSYNEKIEEENKNRNGNDIIPSMPYIIVIVDDYNSLNSIDEINDCIENITGNGWSAGVYMIIASNHPSAKVIPTVSKANFPARMSFKVASLQSSQSILGDGGAEKIVGYGNALYTSRLTDKIIKINVPNITESCMKEIVDVCVKEQMSNYDIRFQNINVKSNNESLDINDASDEYNDPLYDDIVEFVVTTGKASVSLLQRRFKLGYNRAARVIDLLEEKGIIGPQFGSKPREVLVKLHNQVDEDEDNIL